MGIRSLPWLAHLDCTHSKLLFPGTQLILCIPLAFPFLPKRCLPVAVFAQETGARWNFEPRNRLQMSFYIPLCFCLHSVSCNATTAFAIVSRQNHRVALKAAFRFLPKFGTPCKCEHAARALRSRTCAIWGNTHARSFVRTGIHFHQNCVSGLISQGSHVKFSFPPFPWLLKSFPPILPKAFWAWGSVANFIGVDVHSALGCPLSTVLLFVCLVQTVMWFFVVVHVLVNKWDNVIPFQPFLGIGTAGECCVCAVCYPVLQCLFCKCLPQPFLIIATAFSRPLFF